MKTLTISKIAKESGVGVETVRFYERKGLVDQPLKPPSGGYRTYPIETAKRIHFIREAQKLGFSLREIKELLLMQTDPSTNCGDFRDRAQIKFKDINLKITQLRKIKKALEKMIASCPGEGTIKNCSIIYAIETNKYSK